MNGDNMDKLCAHCQGAVVEWGMAPEEEAVLGYGWCSHCLTRNAFTLITKNYIECAPPPPPFLILSLSLSLVSCSMRSQCTHIALAALWSHTCRRNDYECSGCHRPACFCVTCGAAYTRGTAALCVRCEGAIESWDDYEANVKRLLYGPAWCSWCIEFTAHRQVESNLVRRNVYECTNCRQRTLPCTHCDECGFTKRERERDSLTLDCRAMAEGGPAWDDDLCEKCRGRIWPSWDDARREKERVLTAPITRDMLIHELVRL